MRALRRLSTAVATRRGASWIVLRSGHELRWGGERRRLRLFEALAERTNARVIESLQPADVERELRRGAVARALRRPRLAASETLPLRTLAGVVSVAEPVAVAVYDDPIAQTAALGVAQAAETLDTLRTQRRANLDAFRLYVVPTASFAALVGLDAQRVITAGNGTDVEHIRPGPWPTRPRVGLVSGAAPGRGIETLVEAARIVRASLPDVELLLWLVGTGAASTQYLAELRAALVPDSWIRVETAPYAGLSEHLAQASLLCVPHPPNDYMDVALPVKLLDAMAAARPLVVTPRTETVRLVERLGCGVVADDAADGLAAAMLRLLEDEPLARRLGAAGREAALREFDWRVVGERVADEVLRREG